MHTYIYGQCCARERHAHPVQRAGEVPAPDRLGDGDHEPLGGLLELP